MNAHCAYGHFTRSYCLCCRAGLPLKRNDARLVFPIKVSYHGAGVFSTRAREAFGRHVHGGCLSVVGKLRGMRGRAGTLASAQCCPPCGRAQSSSASRMQSKLMRGHVTFADDDADVEADGDAGATEADGDTWRPVRAHNAIKLAVEQRLASHDPLLKSTFDGQHSSASLRESVLSITQPQQPLGSVHSTPAPHNFNVEAQHSRAPSMPTALSGASSHHLQQQLAGLLDPQQASVGLGPRSPVMPGVLQHLEMQSAAPEAAGTLVSELQSSSALSSRTSSPQMTVQALMVRCSTLECIYACVPSM